MHFERVEDVTLDVRGVRLLPRGLDHQAEDHIARIRVLEGFAGNRDQMDAPQRRNAILGRRIANAKRNVPTGIRRQPAGVRQQMP
jgi:hypothetical protein